MLRQPRRNLLVSLGMSSIKVETGVCFFAAPVLKAFLVFLFIIHDLFIQVVIQLVRTSGCHFFVIQVLLVLIFIA